MGAKVSGKGAGNSAWSHRGGPSWCLLSAPSASTVSASQLLNSECPGWALAGIRGQPTQERGTSLLAGLLNKHEVLSISSHADHASCCGWRRAGSLERCPGGEPKNARCFAFSMIFFLEPRPQHMEVPKLGVESELQLPAYAAATATPDPSCNSDLYHGLWQCQILNPPSKARDQTYILASTKSGS